jgi:hypothetical protein
MALIVCPDCESQVSDQALACPKCARPMAAATIVATTPDVSKERASSTLSHAGVGFFVGFMLVWGGCGKFESMEPNGFALSAFGGAIFAILGAILGAVLGGSKQKEETP